MNHSSRGVIFADPAAQSLLRDGRLDPRWVGAFFALAEAERSDERTWAPEFVRLRHFVSTYLPLRYSAWTRASGKRNPETEELLATVVVGASETLWRGLLGAARLGAASEAPELVHLILGAGNPLRMDGASRAEWEQRYKVVVKEMSATWSTREAWPRWETMALHVASFYLPLGLPSVGAERTAVSESGSRERLLGELRPHVHPDVLQLIGLWLASAEALRDDAGLPIVEWSPATGRRLTGRTETEILLLG